MQTNLTPSEALALISAVQIATTITEIDLIQKDAVMAAKKIQESLGKDSEIFKFLELGWKIREGSGCDFDGVYDPNEKEPDGTN